MPHIRFALCTLPLCLTLAAGTAVAQDATPANGTVMMVCASKAGERQACAADTSGGVSLVTVLNAAVCERDKSWGYDSQGIWVADGCSAVFAVRPKKTTFGTFSPAGFKVADTSQGDLNVKLFTYVRYLNQEGLDHTFTDSFGTDKSVNTRHDIHLQKVNVQFLGWILSPKLRYVAYVWTANVSQGQLAQVVVGGNIQYRFNSHVTLGGGIGALPGTRSLEGNFPYWLTLDNRPVADEYFRPSYTQGIWAKGLVTTGVEYAVMLGNNLSQFGVDAGQLSGGLDTVSSSLAWMPTTGEFGSGFGDFEGHERLATRVGLHYTRSDENRQSQPDTEAIDNAQIRISDGNIIFAPGLFGEGIAISDAQYHMTALDAGLKYRGLALEGEYYWRAVTNLRGPGTDGLPFSDLRDNGFQLQASAMVVPKTLQAFVLGSKINGQFGDPWDMRIGANWFPWQNQIVRWHTEYAYFRRSPVGALSLPMVVGGNGPVFFSDFMISF